MNEERVLSWAEMNWPMRGLLLAWAGAAFFPAAMALATVGMIIVTALAWLIDMPLSLPIGGAVRWTIYGLLVFGAISVLRHAILLFAKFFAHTRSGVKL